MFTLRPLTLTFRQGGKRRPAFTLLELLLVMAILAAIGSVAIPLVAGLLGDRKLVRGAKLLREEMMLARIDAMRQGRVLMMDAQLETNVMRIQPYVSLADSVNALDQTGTQATLLSGADQGTFTPVIQDPSDVREIELPENALVKQVAVVSAARAMEVQQVTQANQSNGFSQPVLFYPDGTTSTAAVILSDASSGQIVVKLRGITGEVTVSDVGANP